MALASTVGGSLSTGGNLDNGGSMQFGGSATLQSSVSMGGALTAPGSLFFINESGVTQFTADVRGDVSTIGSMYVGGATSIGGDVEFGTWSSLFAWDVGAKWAESGAPVAS